MYFFHISLHGLVRGKNVELGRDSDTGGQITYVLNLIEALSQRQEVTRIDLATRGFRDEGYGPDYARAIETLNGKARIVRFFDDTPAYLRKEMLWPKLPTLRDAMLRYLQEQREPVDAIHAHYADAGWLGAELSERLHTPFLFTGHSLGRSKRKAYLDQGWDEARLEEAFNIGKRIAAEEKALAAADAVIVSTEDEKNRQYADYPEFSPRKSVVLPPGFDPQAIKPQDSLINAELTASIHRFLHFPDRPPILAISRPASKKNLAALVEAFARDARLHTRANLVIFAGRRQDIREESDESRRVFEELLYLVDKHDLYGHVALPKTHSRSQVADIYAYAACQEGVFVNVALEENFGLTLIEAAANGLPVVATKNGGPAEIVRKCGHGKTVDPCRAEEISDAIAAILDDRALRHKMAECGRRRAGLYDWPSHAERYVKLAASFHRPLPRTKAPQWLVVSDIDHTLTGDRLAAGKLREMIGNLYPRVLFAVATGRSLPSALKIIDSWKLPAPEALLTSVGSEITYALRDDAGTDIGLEMDIGDFSWRKHIAAGWNEPAVRLALAGCDELKPQPTEHQTPHKISYFVEKSKARPQLYRKLIRQRGLDANVIYSHGLYLDVLPRNASKARAVEYLRRRLLMPRRRVIVIGDSGNDRDMLLHSENAVVVANHQPELAALAKRRRVYFSRSAFSGGVAEGIRHFISAGHADKR